MLNSKCLITFKNNLGFESVYKPFWFGKHMYFIEFYTGRMYSQTPIYLADRDYATISDLKNYFRNNDIWIIPEGSYYVEIRTN